MFGNTVGLHTIAFVVSSISPIGHYTLLQLMPLALRNGNEMWKVQTSNAVLSRKQTNTRLLEMTTILATNKYQAPYFSVRACKHVQHLKQGPIRLQH